MTPRQPRWLVPALGATAAAALVAALLVAVTRDGGDGDAVLVGDAATTTTSTSDTSAGELPAPDAVAPDATSPTSPPPSGGAPAGGDAGASGGATATTAAPAADLGAPQDPGQVAPPRPGRYRYRTVTEDGSGSKEEETVTTVTDERREGDEVVQVIDGRFGGIESSSRVRWRPSEAHLLETTFRMNGSDGRCDWEPDHLEGSFPLREGHTWSASSSCELTGFGPTPITVTRETTSSVVRLERRRVAGQVLDLWVVEAEEHIEFSSVVIDVTATRWFSPPHGLTVRTEGSSRGSGPRGRSSFQNELLNLEPEQP